jgi:probable F420-dependent oxidoreductase
MPTTRGTDALRYGVTVFATDVSISVPELAVAAEERGFDSVWIPEHTHIPVSRRTPPPTGDAELAEEYKRSVDPLVALAAAASVTTTIRLGTGVLLPAQRDPIVTAKAVATLQQLSGGRFELGAGFGWNSDEIEDHGVEFRTRRARAREHVLAMQALWRDDVASYDGEFVRIPPSWSWPKPPSPVPVLLGGGLGPKLLSHLVDYADGWIPIGGAGLADAIPRYLDALADAGRDPASARIIPFGSVPRPDKLEHFASIGVTECVFRLPSAPAEVVLAELDRQAGLLADLRG